MRRRSTFIVGAYEGFDPSEIRLKGRKFLHPGLKAAREERLVYNTKDLPNDLVNVLSHVKELHLHWIPELASRAIVPFVSRLPPGLHVHLVPLDPSPETPICTTLKQAFSPDLRCQSLESSFIKPQELAGQSFSSPSLQFYSLLPSLNHFVAYVQRNICETSDRQCFYDAALLNIVDHLDLDYDSASQTLALVAFWSKEPPAIYDPFGEITTIGQWPVVIESTKGDKVEVGVLSSGLASSPEEVALAGFLTTVGESDKPRRTQFSFAARHHTLPKTQSTRQAYTVSLQKPTGLHPLLEIEFPSSLSMGPPANKPATSSCGLHAYFTLPSSIFADEYAFTAKDPLFEQSHNLKSIRSISGELDLEAPDYVVQKWGSTMLLELATPAANTTIVPDKPWKVTVPLHLRYLPPADGGINEVNMPWPVIFWACTAEEGMNFNKSPFDRRNLGYDRDFDPGTMFYHLQPEPKPENRGRLVESINVPVLDTAKIGGNVMVEQGTSIVILLGFAWVLLKSWPGLSQRLGLGRPSHKVKVVASKKTN